MNPPAESAVHDPLPPVSLEPEGPDDEGFLFAVYAATRTEELALTNWDPALRQAFLAQQFQAMCAGYHRQFPAGEFSIISLGDRPVGRMVLHRGAAEIRVVDLALLPADRNRGIGTLLLQRVCAEAAAAGQPVRLSVWQSNRAARWYERLGFRRVGEPGVYDEWEWRPATGT